MMGIFKSFQSREDSKRLNNSPFPSIIISARGMAEGGRSSGLVSDERRGQWVYYSLNPFLPDWAKRKFSNKCPVFTVKTKRLHQVSMNFILLIFRSLKQLIQNQANKGVTINKLISKSSNK